MGRWGPSLCASATVATLGEMVITGESGDELSLHIDGCWNLLDPSMFWAPFGAQAFRGDNVIIPSSPGRFAEPWRLDESSYDGQMLIDADFDWLGVPYDEPFEGLETNLAHLVDELVIPPADLTTTRPARLVMPSGMQRVANVQPRAIEHHMTPLDLIIATITIVVPLGRFVVETS